MSPAPYDVSGMNPITYDVSDGPCDGSGIDPIRKCDVSGSDRVTPCASVLDPITLCGVLRFRREGDHFPSHVCMLAADSPLSSALIPGCIQ